RRRGWRDCRPLKRAPDRGRSGPLGTSPGCFAASFADAIRAFRSAIGNQQSRMTGMSLPAHQASPPDTPEAREYNRVHRWLGVADVALGFIFLVALLGLHWSNRMRDWAITHTGDHYLVALLLYVALLTLISKLIGLPLDYYGFRLEHRYNLSNVKFGAWAWDQTK